MSVTRHLGILLIIIGLLFMVGAVVAYGIEVNKFVQHGSDLIADTRNATFPYRNYVFPLILGSTALYAEGFALFRVSKIRSHS